VPPFFDLFLVLFVGLAAGFDLWTRRIPNWLVFLAVTGGILLNAWIGTPRLLDSLKGLGIGIGVFLIPFALGWLGAGDVKLVGAVGAVLGAGSLPRVIFYSALSGGVLAVITIIAHGANLKPLHETWRNMKLLIMSRGAVLPEPISAQGQARTIPYGVAIGCGTLVAFYVDPSGGWAGF